MKSSIILIRHGESLGNTDPKYYEVHDTANILSQKGVDQCLELKSRITSIMNPDKFGTHTTVIASKHQRAKLTAEIVMQGQPYPIHIDARLNECWHESESGPDGEFVNVEDRDFVVSRIRSLVVQHEFDLVLFCHGVLMSILDPSMGSTADNCEVRKYDRDDFLNRILK